MGPVRREQTCGGIRIPASVTCSRVRPRQTAASPASGPGTDQGETGRRAGLRHLGQAREAAQRQVRQDAARDQAELRGSGEAQIAAAGNAHAARQAHAKQAEAELQRARADHDQAAGQAAPASPGPARRRLRSPGNLGTSTYSLM